MTFRAKILGLASATPGAICALLDWLVKIAERLLVLGVAVLAFYFGYHFCRGSLSPQQKDVIAFVAKNWKIVLILMIPLFYQTVRTFLEEVQEAWGIKRSPKQPLTPAMAPLPELPTSKVATSPPEEE